MKQASIGYLVGAVLLLLALLFIFGILRIPAQTQVQKAGWPRCKGIPANLPAIKSADDHWQTQLKLTPTNAPCYVDITATASDGTAAQTSQPIRIYVKKK